MMACWDPSYHMGKWSSGWRDSCERDSGRVSHGFNKDHGANNKFSHLQEVGWSFCWCLLFCYAKWTKIAYDPFRWNEATSGPKWKASFSLSTSANCGKAPSVMWTQRNVPTAPESLRQREHVPALKRVLNVCGKFLPFHNQTELSECADWTHCPILLSFDGRAKNQSYHGSINNPPAGQVAINTLRSCHLTQSQSA